MSPTVGAPARSTDSTQGSRAYRLWRSAAPASFMSVALGVVTFVGSFLRIDVAAAALLYVFIVVLTSLRAGLGPALVVVCLDYFFTPPLFKLSLGGIDAVAGIVFGSTASVTAHLMGRVRKSAQENLALQSELRLAIDTIPALVWSALPHGSFDFTSRRWLEYAGLSPNDGLGWGWTAEGPGTTFQFTL